MDKTYYKEMLGKGRLFPVHYKGRMVCFLTFYITDDPEKYLRDNMWSVEDDDDRGSFCWIDQLWTDKVYENKKLSYEIWKKFKDYIRCYFPSVKIIRWNRSKINKLTGQRELKTYTKELN